MVHNGKSRYSMLFDGGSKRRSSDPSREIQLILNIHFYSPDHQVEVPF